MDAGISPGHMDFTVSPPGKQRVIRVLFKSTMDRMVLGMV